METRTLTADHPALHRTKHIPSRCFKETLFGATAALVLWPLLLTIACVHARPHPEPPPDETCTRDVGRRLITNFTSEGGRRMRLYEQCESGALVLALGGDVVVQLDDEVPAAWRRRPAAAGVYPPLVCQGLRGLVAVAQDGTLLHTSGEWSQTWLQDQLLVEMFREQFDNYTPHTQLFLRRPEAGIVCGKYIGSPEHGNLYECASASERGDWGLCPFLAAE